MLFSTVVVYNIFQFFKKLSSLNYHVKAACLDASYLEVPQMRKRVFIIGIRKDLNKKPVFPKKQKQMICKDVYEKNYFEHTWRA